MCRQSRYITSSTLENTRPLHKQINHRPPVTLSRHTQLNKNGNFDVHKAQNCTSVMLVISEAFLRQSLIVNKIREVVQMRHLLCAKVVWIWHLINRGRSPNLGWAQSLTIYQVWRPFWPSVYKLHMGASFDLVLPDHIILNVSYRNVWTDDFKLHRIGTTNCCSH